MCRLCISKTDGKKAYCAQCAEQIGDFLKKKQIDKIKEEEAKETKKNQSYFNFGSLKKP